MSRLWLIRHGPTHAKSFVGWTDLPADLSDHAAIARLEGALPIVPVISSDLTRAIDTASAVQANRPRLAHDHRLREINFGDWEGLEWPAIEANHSDLARAVFETPGDTAPPNGESWNAFSARVHESVLTLKGETVIVAHMGVILALLQKALGVSAYEAMSHKIDPLSCTIIECPGGVSGHGSVAQLNHKY
ncbi:histidine phosphatase family protein [Celeribacter litoreus]|uniref:histidine phosphatase family protein n=1 Tax=Celeribacter litoreus TaxID=2876714 RepID=UPI001CCD6067|nr:histidine phosphatase family protein [Celeribacter litoreus]MCA0042692.1 histidine phosphatase family protein [Celeribacter litoreus]